MTVPSSLMAQLLAQEADAWRVLSAANYDQALCAMLDDLVSAPRSADQLDAFLALSTTTLRRNGPTLNASRACCARHLLCFAADGSLPELHWRMHLLFMLAWLRLSDTAAGSPESIAMNPPLPAGVMLPQGADPETITDPALRAEARELGRQHRQEVERWTAKQRALDELNYLANLMLGDIVTTDRDTKKTLAAAMSLAPGLPSDLRAMIEAYYST